MDDYKREIFERRISSTNGSRCRKAVTRACGGGRLDRYSRRRDPPSARPGGRRSSGVPSGHSVLSRLASDYPSLRPSQCPGPGRIRAGEILQGKRTLEECLVEAGKAVTIWVALSSERPDAIEYRRQQAECRAVLAVAYRRLGRLDETDRENKAALGACGRAGKEEPDSIASQYLLGNCYATTPYFRLDRGEVRGPRARLWRGHFRSSRPSCGKTPRQRGIEPAWATVTGFSGMPT